jgi:hydroxypyruvate isomerase
VTGHGLAISAVAAHQPLTIGLNRRDLHDRLEDEIKASIETANRLKIPNLICFSGNRNGLDDQAGAENTAEGLARVAPAQNLKAIKETGHKGYVTHEFVPKGDPVAALKTAFDTCALYL